MEEYIKDSLQIYKLDCKSLSEQLDNVNHSYIVRSIVEGGDDIVLILKTIGLSKNYKFDNALKQIKEVAQITLPTFKYKNKSSSRPLANYLGAHIIKRRATFVYIYMLFIKKNREITLIQKRLGLIYSKMFTPKEFMTKLQTRLIEKVRNNPDSTLQITKVFSEALQDAENYNTYFDELGELFKNLDEKMRGYTLLVKDVIPIITRWSTSTP